MGSCIIINSNKILKEFFELITSDEFLKMSKINSESFTPNIVKNLKFDNNLNYNGFL